MLSGHGIERKTLGMFLQKQMVSTHQSQGFYKGRESQLGKDAMAHIVLLVHYIDASQPGKYSFLETRNRGIALSVIDTVQMYSEYMVSRYIAYKAQG